MSEKREIKNFHKMRKIPKMCIDKTRALKYNNNNDNRYCFRDKK